MLHIFIAAAKLEIPGTQLLCFTFGLFGISFKAGERAWVDEGTIYSRHKVQVYRKWKEMELAVMKFRSLACPMPTRSLSPSPPSTSGTLQ